jgi:hypothetical protein
MSNERYRESVLLRMLRRRPVPTRDALYFRNWPVTPEDAMLSLEEIALRILSEVEERPRPVFYPTRLCFSSPQSRDAASPSVAVGCNPDGVGF